MPARHDPEIGPKIQAMDLQYALFYNTGSLSKQYRTVMQHILRHTLPPRRASALAN